MAMVTAHDIFRALVYNIEWFEQQNPEDVAEWFRTAITPLKTTLSGIYAKLAKHTDHSIALRAACVVQSVLSLLAEEPVDVWTEVQNIALENLVKEYNEFCETQSLPSGSLIPGV